MDHLITFTEKMLHDHQIMNKEAFEQLMKDINTQLEVIKKSTLSAEQKIKALEATLEASKIVCDYLFERNKGITL